MITFDPHRVAACALVPAPRTPSGYTSDPVSQPITCNPPAVKNMKMIRQAMTYGAVP